MESFPDSDVSASDALDLIKQVESETYLPATPLQPEELAPMSARIGVLAAGVAVLTAIMWLFSRDTLWAIPAGIGVSLVFVAGVHKWENSGRNADRRKVALKARLPRHVWWANLKQIWPFMILMGVSTSVIMPWATNQQRPLWQLVLAAALFLAITLAGMLALGRWRQAGER